MEFTEHSLAELRDLAEATATVAAAAEVGIFHQLAREPGTWEEVAQALELDPRAVQILLPALADFGVVEKDGSRFRLTERTRRELGDPESPQYQGRGLPLWLENLRGWTRLPEVLRRGTPILQEDDASDEEALARYMAGMAATPEERIRRVVDACLARIQDGTRALDLGGGPGSYARELARRGLETTLLDRPETVEFVASEYGPQETEGVHLHGADFLSDPLPDGPFHVVLVSNVIHLLGPEENRELLGRVGEVTAPGGVVGGADFIRGVSSRAPRFALVMLLRTPQGNTYGRGEVQEWLVEAGFRDVAMEAVDDDRHLVTGVRAEP